MLDQLKYLIENESENTHLDFKREQYLIEKGNPKKSEFLKDISAMANIPSERDKFIIIGVAEKDGKVADFVNVNNFIDQANYQTYLNEYLEPEINFEYKHFSYEGHKLAYFRVFNNSNPPYLFKKDLYKNGQQLEIGDGFIRSGTSTRKLKRDDFELIYKLRYKTQDRKGDVTVSGDIKFCDDNELRDRGFVFLDIELANNSNKSIDLDIEITVYKSDDYTLEAAETLKRKWRDERFVQSQSESLFSPQMSEIWIPHLTVSHEEHSDYLIFRLNGSRYQKAALTILQSDNEKDVFDQQIAIDIQKSCVITADVIVRSDDFSGGVLEHRIKIPFEY